MGRICRHEHLQDNSRGCRAIDCQDEHSIDRSFASRNEHTMSFRIVGIGTAVPRELITQDDAARLAIELAGQGAGHGPAIQTLYRKSGVQKRHSTLITSSTNGRPATQSFFPVAAGAADRGPTTGMRMRRYERSALELAAQAACIALRDSGTSPAEIVHLVTVSCTGFSAPGVDIGLVECLGLNRGVSRTHIGFMGCHGALNGMRVAAALSSSAPAGKVLLCCVELCSLHHQYAADPQQIVANALFSDGAAAVVGASYFREGEAPAEPRPENTRLGGSLALPDSETAFSNSWRLAEQFSLLLPDTADLMAWRIGDNGFDMRLSPQVPGVIREMLRPWLCEQLSRHGLSISDVRAWAIHPGGPRILTACAESLGLDPDCLAPSQQVLADYGNMSSPTVLFVLERLRTRGDALPCVVLAFGPGLAIEAALIA
jgi:predicted naringenin-chalcone synthase